MKSLGCLVAGLNLLLLPAAAEEDPERLSPPVNVLQTQLAPQAEEEAGRAETPGGQSMVIEEDGTVRFLTPEEAAGLFIPPGADSNFVVEVEQSPTGPDSLHIEVTGAEITDSVTQDGEIRVIRVVPDDGSPARIITITKD